ncbi:myosin heavy chain 95F jaguar isoform X2 [Arctopsyche grandis]|uniref:myosin heavy chain 95F jaguar isoform X2 n=1 Tax=Arctopsyche grandis TaxID=121162 RepID=UPI00406D7AD2
MDKQVVWARDPNDCFILAKIHELLGDDVEIVPIDPKFNKRTCSYGDLFPAGDYSRDVDDNCNLMFLNEPTLLNNVQSRYKKDKIYTYVANILIAVNPYKEIRNLYSSETIKKYHGASLGKLPPHVFAIADKSFRDMKSMKQSQSIIVSGESGAGKTESTKYILKYLCDLWAAGAGPVEQKILDANPVLEAFGNAKTTRNNNSSRFGKFMEVHFSNNWQVVGGHISHYLLEKSRICIQSPEERNYHVFYMLCAGAPPSLRQSLKLTKPDDYTYLKNGCTQYFTNKNSEKKINTNQKSKQHESRGGLKDPMLDDVEDFAKLDQALSRLGISESERMAIYALVAAVLHLGNIEFEDSPEDVRGGCKVKRQSESTLTEAARLLGIDPGELRMALVSRLMQSSRGGVKGTAIMVPLKIYEANNARDALAKAVYSKLFDHIVCRINQSIPFQASSYYVGILDIAGFEYFTVNSYEQFCINYCNEKLQQFFNERILNQEQLLYKQEGLNVPKISYVDNQDCIDVIESRGGGIFNLLDEESKLPKPDYIHFTMSVHKQWGGKTNSRLALPRNSRLKSHRTIRDDEGFLIRHFAGAVCYNTNQFIEKNNDALHASLEFLVQESNNKLIQGLFQNSLNNHASKGKLNFISVGSKFQTQLGELMEKLNKNATNFIRCVKPNSRMVDNECESSLILTQLQCSGMISVLELMEHGFPSRAPFQELHSMYKSYLPPKLSALAPKIFCEAVLHSFKLNNRDFKFGLTKVFFRPGKYAEFDTIMKSDPENLKAIVDSVSLWLIKSRWRQSIFGVISIIKLKNKILYRRECLILLQKSIRGYIVRKQHKPRYKGIMKIKALQINLADMAKVTNELKTDKPIAQKKNEELKNAINNACRQIKNNEKISSKAIDDMYNDLSKTLESQMAALQSAMIAQKNRDEQERLRKIEEEMKAREEAKRKEEQRLRDEEENRKIKIEMELRRKAEEAERLRQEEEDKLVAKKLQEQLDQAAKDERDDRERLDQERQDHDMAVRLAKETNGHVEGSPPQLRSYPNYDGTLNGDNKLNRSEKVRMQQAMQENQKFDLSKWKYSELRDTINTSCDIELLEACRHEFHRRLKVYHAWKAGKQKRTTMAESERAPRSVMEAAKVPRVQQKAGAPTAQHRYFKIPFVRPQVDTDGKDTQTGERKGWWYAHFDGQFVARQMELHPDKSPVLLSAGVDDMQMCELSLDETGLTRKRGAEILEQDFVREWERHGGASYASPSDRRK